MKLFKDTLEMDIKKYVFGLPYWAKFLANKILSENVITEDDIDCSYSFLLEELKLKDKTEKREIKVNYNVDNVNNFEEDLILSKLENVEGVNALAENQTIVFNPNLTIIYGSNGSGKSGYVRLLKKVFYSKAPEEILYNVHIDSGHKPINAIFNFLSNNETIPLTYSDRDNIVFKHFAVFDGKSVLNHLERKNEFEFRPAGLKFFADYSNTIIQVEQKLNNEINNKQTGNTAKDLSELFEGESEIKTIVQNLNAKTKIDDLKKYIPFSDEEKAKMEEIQQQYENLYLASKGKEKEVKKLEKIKTLLSSNKQKIEKLNRYFTNDYLTKVKNAIIDCISKEDIAPKEGIENFETDKIDGIGTEEWKNFIVAAKSFAQKQKPGVNIYPTNRDNCLLCQQSLSEEAEKLITNYWTFIKSKAEANAIKAQETLDKAAQFYRKLDFNLFPEDNMLAVWLSEKYPKLLEELKNKLSEQKALCENIVSDIQSKTAKNQSEIVISFEMHTTIETDLNKSINSYNNDEQSKELRKLLKAKTLLVHKEKYNNHFSKFTTFINDQAWIEKAKKANYGKHKITSTEKALSNKYFNQKYIDTFNSECQKLNGNFGIEISHTGSAGKSYRKLKLKGKNPNAILSEGEQKVIAIADFISEMSLSEINKGLIFDDPVSSLDDWRKSDIAKRLAKESKSKQIIVFTHDLIFVSNLITYCEDNNICFSCHWIENRSNKPGQVFLNNSPSYEKGLFLEMSG